MAKHPIRIDATAVFGKAFAVIGIRGWIDSTKVRTLQLEPGTYQYQVRSGAVSHLRFTVTEEGTVDYDAALDAVVSGRGTDTLTVTGVETTIDARYLTERGVLLSVGQTEENPLTDEDWILHRTIRLVPAPHYSLHQGSGQNVAFVFEVTVDGSFQYDAKYDVRKGGFVRGLGRSTLELFGHPILVDARAAGGSGLLIQPVSGLSFTPTAVQLVNLLPVAPGADPSVEGGFFALQIGAGYVTKVRFSIDTQGNVSIDKGSVQYLEADSFHGVTRLTVTRSLPGPQ